MEGISSICTLIRSSRKDTPERFEYYHVKATKRCILSFRISSNIRFSSLLSLTARRVTQRQSLNPELPLALITEFTAKLTDYLTSTLIARLRCAGAFGNSTLSTPFR